MSHAHTNRPRCIYTGNNLDATSSDPTKIPCPEHIIPLSLGGTNSFMVNDVSRDINNRVGNEIENRFASSFPIVMLRHKYKLAGHSKTVPPITFNGSFTNIGKDASLVVQPNGDIIWNYAGSVANSGNAKIVQGTEDQVRTTVLSILKSIEGKNLTISTPLGEVTDAEDIEVAIALAGYQSGNDFECNVKIDLKDFYLSFARLMTKIALCAGHLSLGKNWSLGVNGIKLRKLLFASESEIKNSSLIGLQSEPDKTLMNVIGVSPDRHVVAILPNKKSTVVYISLFGGCYGTGFIKLGPDMHRKFYSAKMDSKDITCVYQIDLHTKSGSPKLTKISFRDIADKFGFSAGW